MLMALGSCCLVTCCNCLRVGAAVMANYRSQQDRDADRNEAQVANGAVQRGTSLLSHFGEGASVS